MIISEDEKMDLSEEIVLQILDDLQGRAGIGNEIDNIDEDVRGDLELDLKRLTYKIIDKYKNV